MVATPTRGFWGFRRRFARGPGRSRGRRGKKGNALQVDRLTLHHPEGVFKRVGDPPVPDSIALSSYSIPCVGLPAGCLAGAFAPVRKPSGQFWFCATVTACLPSWRTSSCPVALRRVEGEMSTSPSSTRCDRMSWITFPTSDLVRRSGPIPPLRSISARPVVADVRRWLVRHAWQTLRENVDNNPSSRVDTPEGIHRSQRRCVAPISEPLPTAFDPPAHTFTFEAIGVTDSVSLDPFDR